MQSSFVGPLKGCVSYTDDFPSPLRAVYNPNLGTHRRRLTQLAIKQMGFYHHLRRFIWPVVVSFLLRLCPFPVLFICLIILIGLVHYFPAFRRHFAANGRTAFNFHSMIAPFILLQLVPVLLNLVRDFFIKLELQVPWMKIAIVEIVGWATVWYESLLSQRHSAQLVSLPFHQTDKRNPNLCPPRQSKPKLLLPSRRSILQG